jgi:hypothetical protein
MYGIIRSVCSGLVVTASLFFSAGAAHAQAATASPLLSVDQVRDAFSEAGYQVDQAHAWNWTSPPVTAFQVRDANTGRLIMVLVYQSMTAAQAALLEAETHDQALNAGVPTTGGGAPHLITNYGKSVWDRNVAMVQTAQNDVERAYQAQIDCDNDPGCVPTPSASATQPEFSVDVDFLQALQHGTVNL